MEYWTLSYKKVSLLDSEHCEFPDEGTSNSNLALQEMPIGSHLSYENSLSSQSNATVHAFTNLDSSVSSWLLLWHLFKDLNKSRFCSYRRLRRLEEKCPWKE